MQLQLRQRIYCVKVTFLFFTVHRSPHNSSLDTSNCQSFHSHKHQTVERYFFHCYYENTLATSLHAHYEYVRCNQRQGHVGSKPVDCPEQLTELVRSGRYDPAKTKQMTQSELREICQAAEISVPVNTTKVLSTIAL